MKCAVCGTSGYWVAYSAPHGEIRCINHLDQPPGSATVKEQTSANTVPDRSPK